MRRYPDWPSRLERYLQAARGRPFSWGENDCALFACGAVAAMTGEDPAARFRAGYRSLAGARKTLARFAGGGLAETAARLAAAYGKAEVAPLRAQRGDLCLARGLEGIDGLGVCIGPGALFNTPEGWVTLPLGELDRAWRI